MESNAVQEMAIVGSKVGMWLISQNGRRRGKITARYTSRAVYVALIIYSNEEHEAIEGYEVMTGYGYDRTSTGISRILWDLREKLHDAYGVTFSCESWQMLNYWQRELERNGFEVERVI